MEKEPTKPRRVPAGAAVLQENVTDAIRAAVFEELATVGYGRMSIERVARRAGVGKAAIYRRWRSKLPIVLEVVSALAKQGLPTPDTGSLQGDIKVLLEATARVLWHPMAAQIIPDLFAESARNPDMAQALQAAVRDSQRGIADVVIRNAVNRGELSADTDVDLALDLASGPLYWRLSTMRSPLPEGYLDGLAAATTAALAAARMSR
ncbi:MULTISPECIES: TetR/AcrR family transcriptional regulator [Streptomyces]|uniref:TetR/AcrR family transcriptional regulator n=1 Tax=Streptomyces rhizosphaericus TaxID=114699 RepID=A0A6G4AXH5_9ACTN|nr:MULTISPECIES: TetR/AcrR family transcriptional regulator [Streptomyces]MBA6433099.1 TetR/AcrR family transcriptional regulator [Streptomyces sp. GMR22]MBI0375997.1 TetR/AcrR family transcriptional regulator [Streptomyces albiflaviniger]NEW77167.1 TetR/AcrR family transcriptional regulator [Streptomyces rhizosphaericus]